MTQKIETVPDTVADSLVPRPPPLHSIEERGLRGVLVRDDFADRPAWPCSQHRLQWIITAIVTRSNHVQIKYAYAFWSSSGLAYSISTFHNIMDLLLWICHSLIDMLCISTLLRTGVGLNCNFCFHSNVADL